MRIRTIVLIAALVCAGGIPARAQPFADVPSNHWAYAALGELAAKGLIEGYPDGAFRGDRALTRYEMAMVVARLLARIESLQQVPAGPGTRPEITKADFEIIQRLVNEFRVELAAMAVRITAVEEELNAIKAQLDKKTVQVTGAVRFRYDIAQAASGGPLPGNGNPNTGSTDASAAPRLPQPLLAARIAFDGSVAPDVHLIFSVMTSNFFNFNSSAFGFGANGLPGVTPGQYVFGTVDNLFFDWQHAFGWPLEIWLGRFGGGGAGGDTSIGKTYPVQFGPFGLLLNSLTNVWVDTTGNSNANVVDGLRICSSQCVAPETLPAFQMQGVLIRINGNVGQTSYASGEDAYGVDANMKVLDGLRVGGYFVGNTIGQFGAAPFSQPAGALSALYHVYGPAGGSLNPITSRCPAATGGVAGITCPALGSGPGAYTHWDIVPGHEVGGEPLVFLDAEWAQWNDRVLGGSDSGYNVVVSWDLGSLLGVGHALALTTGYQYYGTNFYPPYGNAVTDGCCLGFLYPGNAQGPTATLSFSPLRHVTAYVNFVTGNTISNRQGFTEYEVGVIYKFAASSTMTFLYRDLRMSGVDQANVLRAQLDYSF